MDPTSELANLVQENQVDLLVMEMGDNVGVIDNTVGKY